jgi:hypothetical protein
VQQLALVVEQALVAVGAEREEALAAVIREKGYDFIE